MGGPTRISEQSGVPLQQPGVSAESKTEGPEKTTSSTRSSAIRSKEISQKITQLAQKILGTQKELSDHVVLFKTGEVTSQGLHDKMGELNSKITHFENEAKEVELQLAQIGPGKEHASLEANLTVLKSQIDVLKSQQTALATEAQKSENTTRHDVNRLLLEGTKNPLKAAENFEKASALLQNDKDQTRFPDLHQKMDIFAGHFLKLSRREKGVEKKLASGKYASSHVSKREAQVVESVIRKKVQGMVLEKDPAQKQAKLAEAVKLTAGLVNNSKLMRHFDEASAESLARLDPMVKQTLVSQGSVKEFQLLVMKMGEGVGAFKTPAISSKPTTSPPNVAKPQVLDSKVKLTSKEKKEVSFKIGLLTYLFNRPVGRIAKKLNIIAQNNLKLEKEIESQFRELAGKSSQELASNASGKEIALLETLIKQEKESLAKLKSELNTKASSKLGLAVEKAIANQEHVIERLEAKREVLRSHSGADYQKALTVQKEMEEALEKAVNSPKGLSSDALFRAITKQAELQKIAEHASGPLKTNLEQMNKVAFTRLQAPKIREAGQLTKEQGVLMGKLQEAGSHTELVKLCKDKDKEIRDIIAKEMLRAYIETDPVQKEILQNRIAQLEVQVNYAAPQIVTDKSQTAFQEIGTFYRGTTDTSQETTRKNFFQERIVMLNAISQGGDATQRSGKIGLLTANLNRMQEHIQASKDPVKTTLQNEYSKAENAVKEYQKGIRIKSGDKRLSAKLAEGKGVKEAQQKDLVDLLSKTSALAIGGNDIEQADHVVNLMLRLQGAQVNPSAAAKLKGFFFRSKVEPEKVKAASEALLKGVVSDPKVAGNLTALRNQSEARLTSSLNELKQIMAKRPINPSALVEKFGQISEEAKRYETFSVQPGQEKKAADLVANAFQEVLGKQLDQLNGLPAGNIDENAKIMEVVVQRIILSGIGGLPGKVKGQVAENLKNNTELRGKVEGLIPRFSTMINENATNQKVQGMIAQFITLAQAVKVDPAKLNAIAAFKKEVPFIRAYDEVVVSIVNEQQIALAEYQKLQAQMGDLKQVYTPEEYAKLENFIKDFENYLESLNDVVDSFKEVSKQPVSAQSILKVITLLESPKFKKLSESIEGGFGSVKEIKGLTLKAKELVDKNKETPVGVDPGLDAVKASGLASFVLAKHPVDRFLKWDGLIGNLSGELQKKLPKEGVAGEISLLEDAYKAKLLELAPLEAKDSAEFFKQKKQLGINHEAKVSAQWQKGLELHEKKLAQMVAEKKMTKEQAKQELHNLKEYVEARQKLASLGVSIVARAAELNASYPK